METSAIISISQLNRTDDGLYECIAQNDGKIVIHLSNTKILINLDRSIKVLFWDTQVEKQEKMGI